jgi:hypothetical protein
LKFKSDVVLDSLCFNGCQIKHISGNRIKSVDKHAFFYTSGLQVLDLSNCNYIADYAFRNSSIEILYLNAAVNYSEHSFDDMLYLKHVYLVGGTNIDLINLFESRQINVKVLADS